MKLKEWADITGIKYLTAYRWFKDGKLPVESYQTESGTIIVKGDDSSLLENNMDFIEAKNVSNDAMTLFIKKTVEFSKDNLSIEDFAGYILSNFQIKFKNEIVVPKYSKNKPSQEQIKNHLDKFINKNPKPKPFMASPEDWKKYDNNGELNDSIQLSIDTVVIGDTGIQSDILTFNSDEKITFPSVTGPTGDFKPTKKELQIKQKKVKRVK